MEVRVTGYDLRVKDYELLLGIRFMVNGYCQGLCYFYLINANHRIPGNRTVFTKSICERNERLERVQSQVNPPVSFIFTSWHRAS